MDETKEFLRALFENKPDDTYIIIWQTPLKLTKRFKNVDDAIDFVKITKNNKAEIYYGCGLQDKDHGGRRRGKKEDIVGLPGFYIDIDIKDPLHKNENLPETVDEAVDLVRRNGFDPTMIVHTGHGIHVHWLFKEPEMFEDDTHREKVELMCRRLQETIKIKAATQGWSLDSTYDSTRVLRIPGTFNHKGKKVPVKLIFHDKTVIYGSSDDFDEFLIEEKQLEKTSPAPTQQEQKVILANIILTPSAVPPAELIDDLCEIDTKFKATYQNKRDPKSFPKGKASPSEYALSLASIAVQAGWSDQEIANLIIDWYRRHGHDINKAMRGDYIARTLAVAKKELDNDFITDYQKNIEPTEGTEYNKDVDPAGEQAKKFVSKTLGFNILRIVKYIRENHPYYVMYTDRIQKEIETKKKNNGQVHFESEKQLFNKNNFDMAVAAQINFVVETKPRQWKGLCKKLMIFLEEESISGSYISGRMKEWICNYLEPKRQYDVNETAGSREPFVHDNHWHVYNTSFSRWCYNHQGHLEGIKKTELDLVLIGAEEKRFNPIHPGKKNIKERTTRRAFKIPHNICKPKLKVISATNLNAHMGSESNIDPTSTVH